MQAEQMKGSLLAALEAEGILSAANAQFTLEWGHGEVTLNGEVPGIAAKRRAVALAEGFAGVMGVTDHLRVTPMTPLADGVLRDRVAERLAAERAFARHAVTVVAQNGTLRPLQAPDNAEGSLDLVVAEGRVTLYGRVASPTHRVLAEVLSWWVAGTADVDNRLQVAPERESQDEEIAEAIQFILEKDPMVPDTGLGVQVEGAQATLSGTVAEPDQRRLAERNVWYVSGIKGLENRLKVA